ncbi:unnamed protein product [Calypogeia fissa]
MAHTNGDIPDVANGNGHSSWAGSAPLDLGLASHQKYERLESSTTTTTKGGRPGLNRYALGCALLASFNSILLGYDTGIMSGALLFIKDDLGISEWQEELLVGSLSIVSLLGSASAGRIADAFGRKWTMIIAQLFFLVGALILGVAPNFSVLMVGRFLAGIGVGFALMVAPVYTAEVSPASSRGSLVSLPEIFINVGILLGYICSYALSGLPLNLGWRFMLGFGAAPSIFLIMAVMIMPESPRWLVMQKRFEEAEVVLIRTSGDKAEADLRLAEIIAAAGLTPPAEENRKSTWPGQGIVEEISQPQGKRDGQGVWLELLCPTPPVRRMLILALGIQFFQQSTGIDATVYYSPAVLNKSGITSKSGSIAATVGIGFCKTLFILVATIWLDRVGRRPLLLTSISGMTVSLGVLAIGFQVLGVTKASDDVLPNGVADSPLSSPQASGFAPVLAVLALCSYVAFFSVGMGPINWVLTSEVFSSRLRAQAMGLGILVNRLASGIVSLSFLSLVDAITLSGTYGLFASMGLLGTIFIYFLVPETKGKTLEEIAKLFDSKEDPPPAFLELGAIYGIEEGEEVVDSEVGFPHEYSYEGEEATLIAHEPIGTSIEDSLAQKELSSRGEE